MITLFFRKILLRKPERKEEIRDLNATLKKYFPNFLSMFQSGKFLIKLIYGKRSIREKDKNNFRTGNDKNWPHNQEPIYIYDPEKLGKDKYLENDLIHTELVIKDIELNERYPQMKIQAV